MAINIKELAKSPDLLAGGHRACLGCTGTTIIRQVLLASGPNTVVCLATGCMEVVTTIFPFTAWKVPYIHVAFENAASAISGVEAAYRALKRRGAIEEPVNFIAIGGDGGTYDIGLQALSGALERGHRFLYICYDNEAYMNTGIQRSSATPLGAATSTSPAGKKIPGKRENRKDLTAIVASHNIPYVAQASPAYWRDLIEKVKKALSKEGPSFMNVIMPCNRGWRFKEEEGIEQARLAVETCFWPLFEIDEGTWRLTYKPKEKRPLVEWLKTQGRFKHLFTPGNEWILNELQAYVDKNWEEILKKSGSSS